MHSSFSSSAVVALGLFSAKAFADCVSYGVDFQNGGTYFQNSLSSAPFTFVSEFEGCQNDTAQNILVDPNGDEYLCTDTPLTPDDTPEMSTCPLDKDQLFSGDWSILILSNNGDNGDPIAYERDFSLSVGPQQTTTYTPTVTASAVITPLVNVTSTTTNTVTTTLAPSTVTKPSTTVNPTTTITPAAVTSTKTVTLLTLHPTKYTVSVDLTTVTKTASCKTGVRASTTDPTATITPTIVTAAALSTGGVKPRGRFDRRVPTNAEERIAQRKAKIAARRAGLAGLVKRSPDQATVTVTDTNTADYVTTTTTSTAAATTATVFAAVTTTSTVTPAPITVVSGKTTAPVVTITAATPTKTKTTIAIATSWTTKTITETVTITTEVTPSATAAHCSAIGGTLI
ncbi:MAG: hypothetical protein M1821_006074 [Bathelium mastoideum]|nr:MAG: hypothetical protein M1821_006074 [Bathelium mastoideum]